MPKKRVIQAGGRKEAPVTVVDNSVIAPPLAPEQSNADQEQQDFIRHSELLRTFDENMRSWKDSICTPGNLTYHNPKESPLSAKSAWEYGIVYPLTNPPHITPKKSLLRSSQRPEANELWVQALDGAEGLSHDFTFQAWGGMNEAFRDPYTGENLVDLEVKLRHARSAGKQRFYAVSITEVYKTGAGAEGLRIRNLEYAVGNLITEKPYLHIQKSYDHDRAELLTEPHAIALFNLMDTLIPPRPLSIVPQPEHRTRQETQTPKVLPPARRGRQGR